MEGYSSNQVDGGGGGGVDNQRSKGSFLYGGAVNNSSSSSPSYNHKRGSLAGFHLQPASSGGDCFHSEAAPPHHHYQLLHLHPGVKAEGSGAAYCSTPHPQHLPPRFSLYDSMAEAEQHHRLPQDHHPTLVHGQTQSHEVEAIKAKIIAHPQYSNLLHAYMDCQKVGAPPEVAARLAAAWREFEGRQLASAGGEEPVKDPELDQFMEAYYDMLVKYREELARPLQEATEFMRRIETQLSLLTANGTPLRIFSSISDDKCEGVGSSEEDQDNSGGETEIPGIDPRAEDRELKNHLLRKYSGYLSSLKQELSKKRKKGKLPKDARQKLLTWWELHYKWPYPSETEKVALAESTGLDQKQINNWFINQRKRHWKPSEDMQFMVMDGLHPQNAAALYMEGHYMGDGTYRLGP